MAVARCAATTREGKPCPGPVAKGTGRGFCAPHDPELNALARSNSMMVRSDPVHKAERLEAKLAPLVALAELADIPKTMEAIAVQVLAGTVEVSAARAVAALAQVSVASHVAMDQLAERAKLRRGGMTAEQLRELIERAKARQAQLDAAQESVERAKGKK